MTSLPEIMRVPTEGYPEEPVEEFAKRRRGIHVGRSAKESLALFLVAYTAYVVVGWRVTVDQHVVPYDGMARLAHAYFVWWNSPPKLAAVGFVWPPISTLVYLPAALIKPLATSLVALPLTTGFFAAALLVLLNRLFAFVGMPVVLRYPIVVAFALNPMFVFYATNGMGEVVYLFFLVAAMFFFVKWFLSRQPRYLIVTSLCFAVGILSRWEVIAWSALLTLVVAVALIRQRVSRDALEGMVIAYLSPIAYGLGLWFFANWLIQGSPFFWFSHQAAGFATQLQSQAPVRSTQVVAAGTQVTANLPPVPVGHIFSMLVDLNWRLFPLALVVVVALALASLVRRDLMALTLAVFIALNTLLTAAFVWETHDVGLFQLRYNMRAMPLALIGVAWLYLALKRPWARVGLALATLAILVVSAPLTWRTMAHYKFQFDEAAFTKALATGKDQEGTRAAGYAIGIKPERQMARYIVKHVKQKNAILTDDAQSFPVMLFSGRPGLFWDRIDQGDAKFLDIRDNPWGKVAYMLVPTGAIGDLVVVRYPAMLLNKEPGLTPVYKNSRWLLVRVSKRRPPILPHR